MHAISISDVYMYMGAYVFVCQWRTRADGAVETLRPMIKSANHMNLPLTAVCQTERHACKDTVFRLSSSFGICNTEVPLGDRNFRFSCSVLVYWVCWSEHANIG